MIDKIFISCYQVSKYHNVISRLGESIVKFQVLICQIIMREKVYKSINRISYQNHSVTKIISISPISTSFKISYEGRYPIRMFKQFPIINNININFTQPQGHNSISNFIQPQGIIYIILMSKCLSHYYYHFIKSNNIYNSFHDTSCQSSAVLIIIGSCHGDDHLNIRQLEHHYGRTGSDGHHKGNQPSTVTLMGGWTKPSCATL